MSIFHVKLDPTTRHITADTLKREEYKFEDGKYDVLGLDGSVTDSYFHMILVKKSEGKKLTYFKIDYTTTGSTTSKAYRITKDSIEGGNFDEAFFVP